ncbi:hypothetical protein CERZMDRAFT_101134 [Cercospora zeae-maydis SCOH1-5]|uniref:Uncharacterized protein n=1 Tax=Cercospora zeae-maydis SCOH1-5 TaxID=717836 RepID=A0A6A6F4H0_9PEZI|nr:hypothetical protein CERZMDRAFT_101134 [Cercospora zeae-maydis SCOH1-5]
MVVGRRNRNVFNGDAQGFLTVDTMPTSTFDFNISTPHSIGDMSITQTFCKTHQPTSIKHNEVQDISSSEQEAAQPVAATMSPEQWLFFTQLSQHVNSGATGPASTTYLGGGYVAPDHSPSLMQYYAGHSDYRSTEGVPAFGQDDLPLAVVRTHLTSGSVPVNTPTSRSGLRIYRSSSSATQRSRSSSIGTVLRQSTYRLPSISEVVNNVPKPHSLLPAAPIVRAKSSPRDSPAHRTTAFDTQMGDVKMSSGKGKGRQPMVAVRSIPPPEDKDAIKMSRLSRPTRSHRGGIDYSAPPATNAAANFAPYPRHLPVTEPSFHPARYTNIRLAAAGSQAPSCLIDLVDGAPIPQECPNESDMLRQRNKEASNSQSNDKDEGVFTRLLKKMKLFRERVEPETNKKRERMAQQNLVEASQIFMEEMSSSTDRRTVTRQVVRIEAGKK